MTTINGSTPHDYLTGTGLRNTTIGSTTLKANTTGYLSTAVGSTTLKANTTGHLSTVVESTALKAYTTGHGGTPILYNPAVGGPMDAIFNTPANDISSDIRNTAVVEKNINSEYVELLERLMLHHKVGVNDKSNIEHVSIIEKLFSNIDDVDVLNNGELTQLYDAAYLALSATDIIFLKKLSKSGAIYTDMKAQHDCSVFEWVAKNKELAESLVNVKIERQKEKAKNDKNKTVNKEIVAEQHAKTAVPPSFDIIEMVKKAFKERNVEVFKFLIENQKIDKSLLLETFKEEINMFMFMEQVKLTINE